MRKSFGNLSRILFAVAVGGFALPTIAAAQAQPPQSAAPAADAPETVAVTDIVVTARFRNELLQDTQIGRAHV